MRRLLFLHVLLAIFFISAHAQSSVTSPAKSDKLPKSQPAIYRNVLPDSLVKVVLDALPVSALPPDTSKTAKAGRQPKKTSFQTGLPDPLLRMAMKALPVSALPPDTSRAVKAGRQPKKTIFQTGLPDPILRKAMKALPDSMLRAQAKAELQQARQDGGAKEQRKTQPKAQDKAQPREQARTQTVVRPRTQPKPETRTALMADTLNILFRLDSIRIDMAFGNNAEHWQAFEKNFRSRYSHLSPSSLRLDIYSGASPEGTPVRNRWLGENRGLAIRRLVRHRLGPSVGSIIVHNEAARWDAFYDLIAASNEPWRDEALRIIDLPASTNDNKRDHREMKLRMIDGGKAWPTIDKHYLAPLRSGATAILSWQGGAVGPGIRDTIVVRDTVVMVMPSPHVRDTVVVMMPGMGDGRGVRDSRRDSVFYERLLYPAWAVKTNFLLWGVVAPNIQVEIPLGRTNRWSLEAEYFTPWFVWNRNAQAHQFQNLGLELRHWLGNRELHRWLQGWHIGLAIAGGYYDWEWKKHEGYQGEYINTYINIGYQHRWGKHWGVDAGVGVGGMLTKYRHYYGGSVFPDNHLEPWDKHLIWHDSGHYHWLGPCHANLSLVYLFNAWPFHSKSKKIEEQKTKE